MSNWAAWSGKTTRARKSPIRRPLATSPPPRACRPATTIGLLGSNNCLSINVGGFVGANFGSISGATWTSAPANCAASYACASGTVSVGALGSGGGFVGYERRHHQIRLRHRQGHRRRRAARYRRQRRVRQHDADRRLCRRQSRARFHNAFATGSVGTAGTMWLSAGGFAGRQRTARSILRSRPAR